MTSLKSHFHFIYSSSLNSYFFFISSLTSLSSSTFIISSCFIFYFSFLMPLPLFFVYLPSHHSLHSCRSAINWTSCTAQTWEICLTSLRHAPLYKPKDRNYSQSVMPTQSYRDVLIRLTHRSEAAQGLPVRYALQVNCVLSCPVLSCPVLSCPVLSCTVLYCPVLLFDLVLHSLSSFPLFSSIFLRLGFSHHISVTYDSFLTTYFLLFFHFLPPIFFFPYYHHYSSFSFTSHIFLSHSFLFSFTHLDCF